MVLTPRWISRKMLNIEQATKLTPRVDTRVSNMCANGLSEWSSKRPHRALTLATVLIVGVVGLVPAFVQLVRWSGLPIPRPALIGVACVCTGYALLVFLTDDLITGSTVALIVLGTIAANVPFMPNRFYPVGLDPSLWLFHFPLFVLVVWLLRADWLNETVTRTHACFIALIGWSGLAALFGAGPRLDVAIAFLAFLMALLAVFAALAAITYLDVLDLKTVVGVLVIATAGHAVYAIAQLAHGTSYAITTLGEANRYATQTVSLGPITANIGAFVTGFAGGAEQLVCLCLLSAPPLLLFALFGDASRRWRVSAGGGAAWLLILVRLTVKDAARGAVLLMLIAVVAFVLWVRRTRVRELRDGLMMSGSRGSVSAVGVLIGGIAQFWPTSDVGQDVVVRTEGNPQSLDSASVGSSTMTTQTVSESPYQLSQWSLDLLKSIEGLSVPLLNMTTLGVRVRQYLSVLDVSFVHPLFGVGGGNFAYVALDYGLPKASRTATNVSFGVHNMFLTFLAAAGWPGLLLWLAIGLGVAWSLKDLIVTLPEDTPVWAPAGIACGLLGYAAFLFWDVVFLTYSGALPAIVLAGAAVGKAARNR